jgi:antitoxin HicB
MTKRNKHIGSSLDEFLREEGVFAETRTVALKDAIACQVQQAMENEKITKVEMARRMHTSRPRWTVCLRQAMPLSRFKP